MRASIIVLSLFLFSSLLLCQLRDDPRHVIKVPSLDHEANARPSSLPVGKPQVYSASPGQWVLVDSMTNIYSYALSDINPISYDPELDWLVVVFRGDATSYALTSGGIYYSLSTDGGLAWERSDSSMNVEWGTARYPSGTIFNRRNKFDSDCIVAVYHNLDMSWGNIGVAWVCGGTSGSIDYWRTVFFNYGAGQSLWTSPDYTYFAVTKDNGVAHTGTFIFRTSDFNTIERTIPPSLDSAHVVDNRSHLGGDAIEVGGTTVLAYAFAGSSYLQYHPNIDSAIISPHTIHVIYSTDSGTTWSALDRVDLAAIPGLGDYRTLWSWTGSLFKTEGSMVLDSLGYPHVFCGVQQEPSGQRGVNVALAEIYKDAGGWKGKIVAPANPSTIYDQSTGNTGYLAKITRNAEGTFFAAQWADSKLANNKADLYASGRYWRALHWRYPVNLTNTADFGENMTHLAPKMRRDGDSLFTFFSTIAVESDQNNPGGNPNRTYIYVGGYQLDLSPITYDYHLRRITAPPESTVFSFSVPFSISTLVANVGEESQSDSFLVRCVVLSAANEEVFVDSVWAEGLAYQDSVSLVFPNQFLPPDTGWYTVRVLLKGDQYASNDTASITVRVIYPSSVSVSFTEQWNLISAPLLRPDMHYNALYPDVINGTVYKYASGYQSVETLKAGEGYWAKFPSSLNYTLMGYAYDSIDIPVTVGWNLIGSIGTDVSVSSITSEPPGVVTSQFFAYTKGYVSTDTIVTGNAYWVKVSEAGTLKFSSSPPTNQSKRIRVIPISERPPAPPDDQLSNPQSPIPNQFALEQSYPNPFNPRTVIRFQLPVSSFVTLKVYNVLGQVVATLVEEEQAAGYKQVEFDANNLSSGVYMYRLTAGKFTDMKKMMVLK